MRVPTCPHPQLLTPGLAARSCLLAEVTPQEELGAGTLSRGRRPSDTQFSTVLNHVLSPPTGMPEAFVGKEVHLGQS